MGKFGQWKWSMVSRPFSSLLPFHLEGDVHREIVEELEGKADG